MVDRKYILVAIIFLFVLISRMYFYHHIHTNLGDDIAQARDDLSYVSIAKNIYHHGIFCILRRYDR